MAAPEVSAFGDGSHAPGSAGLTIDGAGFGAFPGSAWIYENADLTGQADELTVNSWNDLAIDVDVPGSLNNTAGTRYLFVQRADLAWSNALAFTLESVSGTDNLTPTSIESASEVSAPAIGQVHALTANSVESASEVSSPAIAQGHALVAVSVESASEVSAPAITQVHALTATSVESASEVSMPALGGSWLVSIIGSGATLTETGGYSASLAA